MIRNVEEGIGIRNIGHMRGKIHVKNEMITTDIKSVIK